MFKETVPDASPKYFLKDAQTNASERERLDLQHQIWLLLLDNSLTAAQLPPDTSNVTNVTNILDIGTGTGLWAIEFARQYPAARVWGTDFKIPTLVSQFKESRQLPSNVSFGIADAERKEGWDFSGFEGRVPEGGFDYIHARLLTYGIHDWDVFFARCFEHLRPGGVLEVLDVEKGAVQVDEAEDSTQSATTKLFNFAQEGALKLGIDRKDSGAHRGGLEKAGFKVISVRQLRAPVGEFEGQSERERQIGRLMVRDYGAGLPVLGEKLAAQAEGMDSVKGAELGKAAVGELGKVKFQTVWNAHVARKK